MHSSTPEAHLPLPAIVLALALLGAFVVGSIQVLSQVRMVPGTVLLPDATRQIAGRSNTPNSAKSSTRTATQVETGVGWVMLNTPQKLALYPLAERWALIGDTQKRRWLAIASSFSSLPEDQQAKLHERMTEWANLSAQQRNQARLNFGFSNRLARNNKQTQWEAYQALTQEERSALAAQAAPRPRGAATALQPVSPKKLAQVPAAAQANPSRPNAPKILPPPEMAPRLTPGSTVTPVVVPSSGSRAFEPVSTPVETAPIFTPIAVPAPLPPLSLPTDPEAPGLPVTPDTSGLYPQ